MLTQDRYSHSERRPRMSREPIRRPRRLLRSRWPQPGYQRLAHKAIVPARARPAQVRDYFLPRNQPAIPLTPGLYEPPRPETGVEELVSGRNAEPADLLDSDVI